MTAVIHTPETKVKDTCDQLIAWGFCCQGKAAWLVKNLDSPEYAIMCDFHKRDFTLRFALEPFTYLIWNLELNQKLADKAVEYWEEEKYLKWLYDQKKICRSRVALANIDREIIEYKEKLEAILNDFRN